MVKVKFDFFDRYSKKEDNPQEIVDIEYSSDGIKFQFDDLEIIMSGAQFRDLINKGNKIIQDYFE